MHQFVQPCIVLNELANQTLPKGNPAVNLTYNIYTEIEDLLQSGFIHSFEH